MQLVPSPKKGAHRGRPRKALIGAPLVAVPSGTSAAASAGAQDRQPVVLGGRSPGVGLRDAALGANSEDLAQFFVGGVTAETADALARLPPGVADVEPLVVHMGFATLHQLAEATAAAVVAHAQGGSPLDPEVEKVVSYLLGHRVVLTGSNRVLAATLGLSARHVPPLVTKAAAAFFNLQRAQLSVLERALAERLPRGSLLHHIESVQYDETPLPTKVHGVDFEDAAPQDAHPQQRQGKLSVPLGRWRQRLERKPPWVAALWPALQWLRSALPRK